MTDLSNTVIQICAKCSKTEAKETLANIIADIVNLAERMEGHVIQEERLYAKIVPVVAYATFEFKSKEKLNDFKLAVMMG
ncbi:MAG: hypothetical protein J6A89_01310 [Clostridia bacterium]|nr:hypothetical protein [Clostridia bacterium]